MRISKTYLNDERDRRIQQTAEESDQSEVSIPDRRQPLQNVILSIPDRRQPLQNVIPCYDRYSEKMDRPPRRLGKDTCAALHILRWKDAGIGERQCEKTENIPEPDIVDIRLGNDYGFSMFG